MEQSSPTAPDARGASSIEAAVVRPDGGAYTMFAAAAVTADGALLGGGLLLEIGEEVLLELRLDGAPLRVRARVVAILPGEQASMQVTFIDVDAATRKRLG
jgi:hypothetical protein